MAGALQQPSYWMYMPGRDGEMRKKWGNKRWPNLREYQYRLVAGSRARELDSEHSMSEPDSHPQSIAHQRRLGRVMAMQALFALDASGQEPIGSLEALAGEHEAAPAARDFADTLVHGVLQHQETLDTTIGETAPQWPLEQIARVDRSVLRVALFELLFGRGVPPKVVINEAIEIAKAYGGESSGRFVNGVLGRVVGKESER